MRAHVIKDGKVINTIEVKSLDILPNLVSGESGGKIGDTWNGQTFLPPQPPVPTVAEYTNAVQNHLDAAARLKNYDNILSACSYAGAPNAFQAEGQKFVKWRGDVWAKCYAVMAEVQAGTRSAPTIDGLIALLPTL